MESQCRRICHPNAFIRGVGDDDTVWGFLHRGAPEPLCFSQLLLGAFAVRNVAHRGQNAALGTDFGVFQGYFRPEGFAIFPAQLPLKELGSLVDGSGDPLASFCCGIRTDAKVKDLEGWGERFAWSIGAVELWMDSLSFIRYL